MAAREQGIALLIAETTIQCGVGQDVGPIDLPIQRDKVTRTPVIYGSSLKGGWRDAVRARDEKVAVGLFGPRVDTEDPPQRLERGAVGVGEARALLYPVPSVQGLFAYVTCPGELARLRRACAVDTLAFRGKAKVPTVALGEFTLTTAKSEALRGVGEWVGAHLLTGTELDYWRKAVAGQSVIVSDDQFRAFVDPSAVVTRVQLEEGRKTVKDGALLTEEVLPADVILWAVLTPTTAGSPAWPASCRRS